MSGINSPREADLLNKARSGDPAATQALYEQYLKNSPAVLGLLRRALPHPEDREDALHDILIALLESRAEFRGEAQLSTYVFQVARVTLLQRFRRENTAKRGGLVRTIAAPDARAEPAAPGTPHYYYEQQEMRQIVRRQVAELPEVYREAVWLRAVEGLTYEEVAVRLQIPPNTAATRIHKGKQLLMGRLKGLGYWKVFFGEK